MRRFGLVCGLWLPLVACASGRADSEQGCDSGQVDLDGDCVDLCLVDADCPSESICVEGQCRVGSRPPTDVSVPDVTVDPVTVLIVEAQLAELDAFVFTGTAADADSPIAQVEVQIIAAGSGLGAEWAPATVVATDNSATWSYRWFPKMVAPLPSGTYAFYARAVDAGGNAGLAPVLTFATDLRPPPTPRFTAAPPLAWKFTRLPVSVAGEVGSFVEVFIDNVAIPGSPFALAEGGVAAINLTLPSALGAHPVAIFGVDANGNRNDTPLATVVERIPYDCLTQVQGFPAPGVTVVSQADFSDPAGLVTITYEIGAAFGENARINAAQPVTALGPAAQIYLPGTHLFKFWAALLPSCATIESAVLSVTKSTGAVSPVQATAWPLLRAWNEESVTWSDAGPGGAWQSPGATGITDRGGVIGTVSSSTAGAGAVSFDVTIPAQGWAVSPSSNHGIVIVGASAAQSWLIYTDDWTTASQRPQLILRLREPD